MRLLHSKRKWVILGIVVLAAAVGVGVAVATVTSKVLADTNVVRERIVRSEFVPSADQPIFDSLWHRHPGPVIVQVQRGYLLIYQGSCIPKLVGPGQTYIEVPDLPVDAVATKPVRWTSTLILPDSHPGDPDRTPVTHPPCSYGHSRTKLPVLGSLPGTGAPPTRTCAEHVFFRPFTGGLLLRVRPGVDCRRPLPRSCWLFPSAASAQTVGCPAGVASGLAPS